MALIQIPRCCTPTLLARIATMFATCAWGVQVLVHDDALNPGRFPIYDMMLSAAHENVWATGGIGIALVGATTQVTRWRGRWIESAAFALMSLFWVYLASSAWYYYPTLPPTGWPCILTVTGLSIFGATSEHHRGPAD